MYKNTRELSPAEQGVWDWDDEDDLDTPPRIKLPVAKQEQEKLEEEALAEISLTLEAALLDLVEQAKTDIYWAEKDLSYDLGGNVKDSSQGFSEKALEMLGDMMFSLCTEILSGKHDDIEGMAIYE